MVPGGATELISYFAGHFHIAIDEARARLDYVDGALKPQAGDYIGKMPSYQVVVDLDELNTYNLPPPEGVFESASAAHPGPRNAVADKVPTKKAPPPSPDDLE